MSRRKLTEEELHLWRRITRTTDPLDTGPGRASLPFNDEPENKNRRSPAADLFRPAPKSPGHAPHYPASAARETALHHEPVRMDKKTFGKLKRGKVVPEARIDLHGMTLAQAQPALIGFTMRGHADGKRLLLVITGKGRAGQDDGPIPERRGLLRHAVPQWLAMPPLSSLVLQISEAHARHGGSGAFYVYLSRKR